MLNESAKVDDDDKSTIPEWEIVIDYLIRLEDLCAKYISAEVFYNFSLNNKYLSLSSQLQQIWFPAILCFSTLTWWWPPLILLSFNLKGK